LRDAGEHDAGGIGAGGQHTGQLTAGDDVEAGAGLGQQRQYREVAVGLDRVAHLVGVFTERTVVRLPGVEDHPLRVHPARRAVRGGDVGQRRAVEMQHAVAPFQCRVDQSHPPD
jgi:hypothetical protein